MDCFWSSRVGIPTKSSSSVAKPRWTLSEESYPVQQCMRAVAEWWVCPQCAQRGREKDRLFCRPCADHIAEVLANFHFEG